MANLKVVYDASVLYPAPLRDFLMWLALTDLFKARWTEQIHDEWMRNVLKNRPELTLAQLTRTRNLMNIHVQDSLVTGYEFLIPTLTLPDSEDRHVLAAAIHAQADLIVTFNLKDFPSSILSTHKLEAIHPDEFILELIDMDWVAVIQAAEKQRSNLLNPPKTRDEYLQTLTNQGLAQTAQALRELFER